MRKLILLALFAGFLSANARADWDPVMEAREEAKRKTAQQEDARRKAAADKMVRDANMKGMRQQLGKEAAGKSDAEVERLYKQQMAAYQKQGAAAAASGAVMERDLKKLDAGTRAQRDAQMKGMTGKSVTELNNMTDQELEAFSRDMEKKFGVK